MTKNQKMLLGVGVLAVAGYIIYNQNKNKSTTPAAFAGKRNAAGTSAPKPSCRCSKQGAMVATLTDGTKIYECCGAGMFGYKPGTVVADCANCGATSSTTVLQQAQKSF